MSPRRSIRSARTLSPKPLVVALSLAFAAASAGADSGRSSLMPDTGIAAGAERFRFTEADIPWGSPIAPRIAEALQRGPADHPAGGAVLVTNCNDDGPGSLRAAIDGAADGAVIDLSGLTCSGITLTSGALVTNRANLTLVGPGHDSLFSVSMGDENPDLILAHLGTGDLVIRDLALTGGGKYRDSSLNANGGCISSSGNVHLENARAKYCYVRNNGSGLARGGAIFAGGDVHLTDSIVSGNQASANTGDSVGGGIFAGGDLTLIRSTVSGNGADTASSNPAHGKAGGIAGYGNVTIAFSTVSGNSARNAGGVMASGEFGTHNLAVWTSTIANNTGEASQLGGGLFTAVDATLDFATISGNTEIVPTDGSKYGAGVTVASGVTLRVYNSIISGNESRLGTIDWPGDIGWRGETPVAFTSESGNYVSVIGQVGTVSDGYAVPENWITTFEPGLGPLTNNGGSTWTMMPLKRSPAIDAETADLTGYDHDQRGEAFVRPIGAGFDIGAVETDTLFANGVESPP